MLTLRLFESLVSNKNKTLRNELHTWAKIEYKHDAEYAYDYMLRHGVAPSLGAIE